MKIDPNLNLAHAKKVDTEVDSGIPFGSGHISRDSYLQSNGKGVSYYIYVEAPISNADLTTIAATLDQQLQLHYF